GLAISPTIIMVGSLGGQIDICIVLFVTLALLSLNRDKPAIAWAFFALGMLVKLQTVIVFPLLVIVTFRRYGCKKLIIGVDVCVSGGGTYLLPFALGMGIQKALFPIYGAPGTFSTIQVWSLNFWSLFDPQSPGIPLAPPAQWILDTKPLLGSLRYRD